MEIKENVPFTSITTLAVGGAARYFCCATSVADIQKVLSFAQKHDLPLFILGGGSNILVSDQGFPGVVLKIELVGIHFESRSDGTVLLKAASGEQWDEVVAASVVHNLSGLENLSGIPGTVGGAVVGNIGAYGKEVKDTIEYVDVLDSRTGTEFRIPKNECDFSYRQSFFKTLEGRVYIVLSATFLLSKDARTDISYKELAEIFAGQIIVPPARIREAVLRIRLSKLPNWKLLPTAGSFFKNPTVTQERYKELQAAFPGITGYVVADGVKLSAAYLIDKIAGLRAVREGSVGTFEKQALVIVNYGGARASEINSFAERIVEEVKKSTGIDLEREVESVGQF